MNKFDSEEQFRSVSTGNLLAFVHNISRNDKDTQCVTVHSHVLNRINKFSFIMKFTMLLNTFVVMLILAGLLFERLSFVSTSTSTLQASAQMMGNGGMMQHGMMMNRSGMMMGSGMGMMFPNAGITNNASGTRSLSGIIVTIVSDAQDMGDKAFQPNPIHIKVTNTVTWVNDDSAMHTVTSGSDPNDPAVGGQFNSGLLSDGQAFTHTFKTVGVFNYFCQIHPTMVGQVIVS